jgi:hypothetical protein
MNAENTPKMIGWEKGKTYEIESFNFQVGSLQYRTDTQEGGE